MKIELPEKINICGFEIKIIKEENHFFEVGSFGTYAPKTDKIILDADLTNQQTVLTFIHELVHAMDDIRSDKHPELSEENVTNISMSLFQVLLDNPCIFDLFEQLKFLQKEG